MTKKEKAAMDALRQLAALRWTAPVAPDVQPPATFGGASTGYFFNAYSAEVSPGWSSSIYHGHGAAPAKAGLTGSQGARALYSTRLLALRAMRHAIELECARKLASVDLAIEEESSAEAT